MKRINPKTGRPFKQGDIREDGYVFKNYKKILNKNGFFGEKWLSPKVFKSILLYNVCYLQSYRKNKLNKIKQNAHHKKWSQNNKTKIAAKVAKRRALKNNATPKWLSKEQLLEIEDFYVIAKLFKMYTGETYHVDHIVPLKGNNVSGLHVPWNLQVIPAKENLKKLNKHE